MNLGKSLVTSIVLTGILSAGVVMAQEERASAAPVRCPHPVTITLTGGRTPPTPDPAEFPRGVNFAGSVWNQTAADRHFGHTFHFAAPPKECCLMTSGILKVTVRALQPAPQGTSGASVNDMVYVVSRGVVVGAGQQPFVNGATPNQTKTLTFTIPASVLATGEVSFYIEDDTAAVSAELILSGCCLK